MRGMGGAGPGGPPWLAVAVAAIVLATAAYCVARLLISWRQGRPTEREADAVHVLMGVAMAGMLVPRLRVFWTGGWEVVFGIAAVGFAWLALREQRAPGPQCGGAWPHWPRHHHLQHVLACVAMVYMLAAARAVSVGAALPGAGMTSGAAHLRTIALVLAIALFGYVVWTADRLTSLAPVAAMSAGGAAVSGLALGAGLPASGAAAAEAADEPGTAAGPGSRTPLSPRLAACCEIAMGVAMGYMLIMML